MGKSTFTIQLSKPIELISKEGGQPVQSWSVVTLREPDFGDLADAVDQGTGKMGMMLHLASNLSGIPIIALRKMSMADGMRVTELLSDFLPSGLPTGSTALSSSRAPSGSQPGGSSGDPDA